MLVPIALAIGGTLLFTLVALALLDATRGTPVNRVSSRGEPLPCAVTDPSFGPMIEAYTGTVLRPGHTVDLLANGDETYPRLWADIRAAQRYVVLQMYYAQPGKVADALREVLIDRARVGVEVLVLLDAFGSSLPREYLDSLRAAGVEVAKFRPFRLMQLHTVPHRAHVRAIVIDGEVGYTGGFGIDDKWLGDGHNGWRDTAVRFTGPGVAQLLATFASCWAEATGELIAGSRYWGPAEEPKASDEAGGDNRESQPKGERDVPHAGVLHATPTVGSTPAERLMALSLAGARRSIYLTNAYFVPDDDFRVLTRDAAERGVDVRILTSGDRSDVRTTRYAARARYAHLMECGVRIYEYLPNMVHAKTMVVDGMWCMVGTMNTDNRSMAFNNECNFLALDPDLAARIERMFFADIAHAHEFHLETFRRRPLWQKVVEQGAHGISRIL